MEVQFFTKEIFKTLSFIEFIIPHKAIKRTKISCISKGETMFAEHEINPTEIKPGSIFVSPNEKGFLTLDMHTTTHVLTADEPKHLGGNDNGPAPYDFLHAGLGSCTALTLKMYAKHKGIELEDFHIAISSRRDENKNLIIDKELMFHGSYSEEQIQKFVEISKKCPMHRDLARSMEINTIVKD